MNIGIETEYILHQKLWLWLENGYHCINLKLNIFGQHKTLLKSNH